MSDNTKKTLIEEGTEIEGSIVSQCDISLSGKMDGDLSAPSLDVTRSGAVSGRVEVKKLRSEGEISGDIRADSVELSGKVRDDTVIQAKTMEVNLDQPESGLRVSFGNCQLQVGKKTSGESASEKHEEQQHEHVRHEHQRTK